MNSPGLFILILFILCTYRKSTAQQAFIPTDPEYYAMDRENIAFDDEQVLLFNHRGFISPRQYSVTQFTNVWILPFGAPRYEFNLNFFDKGTVWTYHLFDLLGTDFLPDHQAYKLISHLREGEFLGKYGVYSIARKDSVSSALVGAILGVSGAGFLSDGYGRKNILIMPGILFALSALGCMISESFDGLVVYRLVGGSGVGMVQKIIPIEA